MTEPFVPSTQKGFFANGLAWVIVLLATAAVITGGVWAWRYFTASTSGKVSAQQQIQSGASRIAAYNHFFDLCASVQGLEGQLAAQRTELLAASGDDKARVEANIAGIEGARQQAIAEYNADARKSYTIGQFRSSGLPFTLTPAKEHTSCVTGS